MITLCIGDNRDPQQIIFGAYAADREELVNVLSMIESIRAFGGAHRNATFWVYVDPAFRVTARETEERLHALQTEVKTSTTPAEATWFYYAGKVFAAAAAEAVAERQAAVLAWLDPDTVFLQEPREFLLPAGKSLGYRPVMHLNIGCLWSEPPNSFWTRAYLRMSVREETLFPMTTIADADSIQPFFNAGCLVVRPECGTLRRWVEYFRLLYGDRLLTEMCEQDTKKRVFLHQVALTGAILNHLAPGEIMEFPERINYPIFFDRVFGARRTFNNIADVVTFRHESYFRNPAPDWDTRLTGPADRIAWIKAHLVRE